MVARYMQIIFFIACSCNLQIIVYFFLLSGNRIVVPFMLMLGKPKQDALFFFCYAYTEYRCTGWRRVTFPYLHA
jgi:hypothetical protein